MTDLHEASFVWPDTNPQDVILTGSFDQWSASMHLPKSTTGFEGKVKVPWGARVQYKFIVDGKWMTLRSQPEELDNVGNLNNVYDSPDISQGEAATNHIAPVTHDTPAFPCDNDAPILNNIHDLPSQPETSRVEPTTDHIASFTHETPVSPDDNDAAVIINDPNPLEGKPDIPNLTESTTLPESIPSPSEPTALSPSVPFEPQVPPPTDLHPNPIEPVVSPEPVQQTLPPSPAQSLPVPATPNTPLESGLTPTEPISSKASNPVEFPKSEEKPAASNGSAEKSNPTPLVKPQVKENAPSTLSVESESRPSSVAITSAPSSPASHFRTASEPRSRNVSSKSDSIRSDSKRSKRHSLFGKVKHLFHLDKDS